MSHERWLIIGLSTTVAVIFLLIGALAHSWQWDSLQIATLYFILLYPSVWFARHCYLFWRNSVMQLTTYTQMLKENVHNLHFKQQHPDNLLLELQNEISSLANLNYKKNEQQITVDNMLSQIMDAWSVPVCLFDQELKLTYRNSAMNELLQQPMLVGSTAKDLGFKVKQAVISHIKFDKKWQCQTIAYTQQSQDKNEKHWLFSAFDISQQLNQNQSATQQNVIRVLAHEIRNSLTPMYSMTDTLLSNESLDESQTRLVLSRINHRSHRLLNFISEYSQLSQLPPPKLQWFNISELLNEAKGAMQNTSSKLEFRGEQQCYGDLEQIAQVMINIVKNAEEAFEDDGLRINLTIYQSNGFQNIEINDNGPGFANLENVLTPFYTTKKEGSGIGLSFCSEVVRNHGGQLKVSNSSRGGACILMFWPMIVGKR